MSEEITNEEINKETKEEQSTENLGEAPESKPEENSVDKPVKDISKDAAKTDEAAASALDDRKKSESDSGNQKKSDSLNKTEGKSGYKARSTQKQPQRIPRFKRKICRFCHNEDMEIDYKKPDVLERFITDRGKILPRRVTGTCAKHQRAVATEIKRARIIALLPFIEQ